MLFKGAMMPAVFSNKKATAALLMRTRNRKSFLETASSYLLLKRYNVIKIAETEIDLQNIR